MKRSAQVLLLLAAFFPACQPANDKNPELLGTWQGREWLIGGNPSGQDAAQVSFEFKDDGTYTAAYGSQSEAGTWRTSGEKLYTIAEGKKEKVVKFSIAGGVQLTFDMNRAGQAETIKLQKQEAGSQ